VDIALLRCNRSLSDGLGSDAYPCCRLTNANRTTSYHPAAENVISQYSIVALIAGGCISFFYRVFYAGPLEKDVRRPADTGCHGVCRQIIGRILGGQIGMDNMVWRSVTF